MKIAYRKLIVKIPIFIIKRLKNLKKKLKLTREKKIEKLKIKKAYI
jgi:hypothetical protein